jgi:sensor domain CHASE-containing protein/PAS domain-containing protein
MKVKQNKYSSVSFRLTLLLIGAGLVMVGYFFVITTSQRSQQEQLYESRIKSRQTIFNSFAQGSSDQLNVLAVDYSYWDDMVKFVSGDGKDLEFAKNNIDASLSTFGADAVWVYNPGTKLIYVTHTFDNKDKLNPASAPPFSEDLIRSIFKKSGVYHFYLKTSYGMFEIAAASIHPTTDAKRITPIRGYLFAGKLIGKDYLEAAGKSIEGNALLISNTSSIPPELSSFNRKNGQTQFIKQIADHKNQTIGAFEVSYTANDLAKDRNSQNNLTFFGIALMSMLMLGLFLSITKWVISPLKKVRFSLRKNSGEILSSLQYQTDEFGDISRLIIEFFDQQIALSSQKAEVEEMVLRRTHDLRREHARLQASIDSLEVGFMLTFGSGKLAMCNPALAKILGFTPSESLDPDGTIAITLSQVEQSLKGFTLEAEIAKCLKTGEPFSADSVAYGTSTLRIFGSPVRVHGSEIIGCVILINEN